MELSINLNINLNATPAMQELVKTVCEAYTIKKAAQLAANIICEREGIVAPDDEEPTPEQEAPTAAGEPAPEAPAEEQAPKRKRRSKKNEEPAPEVPAAEESTSEQEAPATEEPAAEAQSDLPFAKETGEGEAPRTEMSIDAFRVKLDQIRDRLGVNDGQPNFEHKSAFTRFARDLMVYYGGTRSEQLTPANLFWYAVQLSSTKLENGEFTCKEPSITPEQVKKYSEAPY